MTRIKFDMNIIQLMSMIQRITKCDIKDCIDLNDYYLIVVAQGQVGKAIGKGGVNVKKIEHALKKKAKLVEFSNIAEQFIKNLVFPLKIKEVLEDQQIMTIIPVDMKTRGYIIGRNASNLRQTESIVKRYFPIKELKVQI